MTLFDRLFYSGPMLQVFSDENRLQRMLDFESALAGAEASLGLIPAEAAEIIAQACKTAHLDLVALQEEAARAGNLAIPMLKQLKALVEETSPSAARYVHLGATSQDVIDTGTVLQMREGLRLIDGSLSQLNESLATMAVRHADTTMAGRTWLQHAVPVTFGWKTAVWLDSMLRHQARLREIALRSLVLQFGGAAGTLAALGEHGPAISSKLADALQLTEADISWHTSRERFADMVAQLGLLVSSFGKIARDLSLLMQTEVSETSEGADEDRGGSSTMPHKRNPVACSAVLAASGRVPGLVATALASMQHEHERGLGNWQMEWEAIPEVFNLCSGALNKMNELIAALEVDSHRMSLNLELTRGLVYAEAVSMALAANLGKPAAHLLVERLCQAAVGSEKHLRDVLAEDQEVTKHLSESDIVKLFDPHRYLGNSHLSIGKVLARASASGVATQSGWIYSFDARLHFKLSGPKHLPVLMLSNSLGSDMSMWDAQVAAFAPHFRILRYDVRGHGRSNAPLEPYTLNMLGRDVITLLDSLQIESCIFCGLSIGGLIGQWLGLNASSRIERLVLSNTASMIGSRPQWEERIAGVQRDGVSSIVSATMGRWFTPPFLRSHPGLMAKTREMIEATSVGGYIGCCAALRDTDLRELVNGIDVPTLVVAGAHDPVTTVTDGMYLVRNIPNTQFLALNASHLSNIEADRNFNVAVLKFLLG
jgi:3-carboxy-cis,cis-muconate cycloisomerase